MSIASSQKRKIFLKPKVKNDYIVERHLGPNVSQQKQMLEMLGCESFESLLQEALPQSLPRAKKLDLPKTLSEEDLLHFCKKNFLKINFSPMIGQGYFDNYTPAVRSVRKPGVVHTPTLLISQKFPKGALRLYLTTRQ